MNYLYTLFLATFLAGFWVSFTHFPEKREVVVGSANLPQTPLYIASKKGSVFGLPWCGSMPRIKDENILILRHINDALEHDLRPIKGCRGLDENP